MVVEKLIKGAKLPPYIPHTMAEKCQNIFSKIHNIAILVKNGSKLKLSYNF